MENSYRHWAKQMCAMLKQDDDLRNNAEMRHGWGEQLRKIHDKILPKRSTDRTVSRKASKILILNGKGNGYKKPKPKTIRYEHVVPLKDIVDRCLKLPRDATIDQMIKLVTALSCVSLITVEEANRLPSSVPPDWDGKDLYIRFKQVGLSEQLIFQNTRQ